MNNNNTPVNLTVVVDNTSHREDAPSEHGLSIHLKSQGHSLLFDAGKSDLVLSNLKALNLLEPSPEWIVFSHGHYDHTNGAPLLLKTFPHLKPYFHPALPDPKWILDAPEQWRYGGVPKLFPQQMSTPYAAPEELIPNVFSSGSLIEGLPTEDLPSRFFKIKGDAYFKDYFIEEQALIISTDNGISIISGCAHTGIDKVITKARTLFPTSPFYALIGGFHLSTEPQKTLEDQLEKMISAGFKKIMPMHCTGENFIQMTAERYPKHYVTGEVGASISL